MEIAIGVLGVVVLGLGAWCFVLVRGGNEARADAAEARRESQRLADENARVVADLERVRASLSEAEARAEESAGRVTELSIDYATRGERLSAAEKLIDEMRQDRARLVEQFEALGGKTLQANQEALGKFLTERLKEVDDKSNAEFRHRKESIDSMIKPINETLEMTRKKLEDIEQKRTDSFASMGRWIEGLSQANQTLRKETSELVHALRAPKVRGAYGEVQLRRVAELAGLREGIDFHTEKSVTTDEGSRLRPDMVVNLPSGRTLVIDAKTNIGPYLQAFEEPDFEIAQGHLERFGNAVADQIKSLSKKAYWSQFEKTPDFVVMFVPGDQFVDAALQQQPELLEKAWKQNIILASPTTLIGLLRAVELGWREQALAENAQELKQLGVEMHKRSGTLIAKVTELGSKLGQATSKYNEVVGSLDRNFVPQLKKFEEAGAKSEKELKELNEITEVPRIPTSGQLNLPICETDNTDS